MYVYEIFVTRTDLACIWSVEVMEEILVKLGAFLTTLHADEWPHNYKYGKIGMK